MCHPLAAQQNAKLKISYPFKRERDLQNRKVTEHLNDTNMNLDVLCWMWFIIFTSLNLWSSNPSLIFKAKKGLALKYSSFVLVFEG